MQAAAWAAWQAHKEIMGLTAVQTMPEMQMEQTAPVSRQSFSPVVSTVTDP